VLALAINFLQIDLFLTGQVSSLSKCKQYSPGRNHE
jgi:hypothetical protein